MEEVDSKPTKPRSELIPNLMLLKWLLWILIH